MRHLLALVLAISPLACLRSTQFTCASSTECGSDGVCEANSFCSFSDATCPMGRRYGDLSGPFAGKCVGDEPGMDGGIDTPPTGDGPPIDMPPAANCKTNAAYTAIAGQATGTYKLITGSTSWNNQNTACGLDGAFLAVPDDATELSALSTLAGSAFWIGIDDIATEGTFVTVLGGTPAFLPFAAGQPDNAQNKEDCVRAEPSTQTYFDERCTNGHRAVCECAP